MSRAPRKPHDLAAHVLRTGATEIVLFSFRPVPLSTLTDAERDVALGVIRGLSNAVIARERGVSARTIANQMARLMKKLDVSSRTELAARLRPEDFT